MAVGGLALAIAAQYLVEYSRQTPWDAVILFVAAAALWWFALAGDAGSVRDAGREADQPPEAAPAPWTTRARRVRFFLALLLVATPTLLWPMITGGEGGFLSMIQYLDTQNVDGVANPDNRIGLPGLTLWIAGVLLYVSAVVERPSLAAWIAGWHALRARAPRRWPWWLAATAAIVVAAFFRYHDLSGLPGRMTSDHVEKLMDLHDLVIDGQHRFYFPRNTGREPFQFYWTGLFSWLLGLPVAFATLKLAMATLSLVGVLATWRLARRIGGELVGIVAAWVIALAPWDIQITRVALRYELGSVFTALCLWALSRALVRGRRGDWLLAATLTAFGLHGYTSFRAVGLLLPLFVLTWWGVAALRLRRQATPSAPWRDWRIQGGHITTAAGLGLLLLAPIFRFAADHPEVFWSRVLTRTTSSEAAVVEPLRQLAINFWQAVRMVNWTTDGAFLISPPDRTALEPIGAALFLLGLLAALRWSARGDERVSAMVVAFPVMLAPSVLALAFPNEVPHLARASGAMPIVAVLAALSAQVLLVRTKAAFGRAGVWSLGLLGLLLLAVMAGNTHRRYFEEYRVSYLGSTHPTEHAATVIRSFVTFGGSLEEVYMIGWPNGWDYRALGVQLGDPYWNGLIGGRKEDWSDGVDIDARALAEDPARKLFFVGGTEAPKLIEGLREIYDGAIVTRHPVEPDDRSFYSVLTP
jgi:hypothetical protein